MRNAAMVETVIGFSFLDDHQDDITTNKLINLYVKPLCVPRIEFDQVRHDRHPPRSLLPPSHTYMR